MLDADISMIRQSMVYIVDTSQERINERISTHSLEGHLRSFGEGGQIFQ